MVFIFVMTGLLLGLVVFNHLGWPRVRPGRPIRARVTSLLIPARNEEGCIQAALESALAQGEAVREILVYDDHSTDGTPDQVRALMRSSPIIRMISTETLPDGWSGKSFACSRLAAAAQGEWLVFLDADARLLPGAVEAMLEEARQEEQLFYPAGPVLHCMASGRTC